VRYEHILQIYWTKGFFFGGNLFYFDKTISDVMGYLPGFRGFFLKKLSERFELTYFFKYRGCRGQQLVTYQDSTGRVILVPLNIIFSQINSVNHQRENLYRLNIIRLYLIKSYRGRCHALGKPARGQRTWSNGWNAFNVNKTLRLYISKMNHQLSGKAGAGKINYKRIQKKYGVKRGRGVVVRKKPLWF
jgi:hypothetical protein